MKAAIAGDTVSVVVFWRLEFVRETLVRGFWHSRE